MRRNVLMIDGLLAAGLAILVLIVTPGLAVVAILAIAVLIACGASLVIDSRRLASPRRTAQGAAAPRPRRHPTQGATAARRPPARRPSPGSASRRRPPPT